jgi:hypothetical protein
MIYYAATQMIDGAEGRVPQNMLNPEVIAQRRR